MRLSGVALAAMLSWQSVCGCSGSNGSGGQQSAQSGAEGEGKILYYRSPMDPTFVSTHPGKDSMGMDLVPVREGDPGADLRTIRLAGATVQTMGVRIATVGRSRLTRKVRALGRVEVDETRITTVNMKFDGWIERLWVDETGQRVHRGDRLFAVYSPELLATQEEYLQVLRNGASGPHSQHLIRAARDRLRQYDVPDAFIDRITRTGQAERRVVIRSPADGYVIHKAAFEGTFVRQGVNLFTIGDLDALWVLADVYEFDAPLVAVGQGATVELAYLPGHVIQGRVDYVYPTLDESNHTIQVRLVLPNPDVALKPGMLATVRIHSEPVGDTLVVPSDAVIHSGERNVAFVALGDGRFEPRDLRLGVWGDEEYQVLEGLEEGEQVVVSGEFLLDSETRLNEAVLRMLGSNVPTGGAHTEGVHRVDGGSTMAAMPGMHGEASTGGAATSPGPSSEGRAPSAQGASSMGPPDAAARSGDTASATHPEESRHAPAAH